MEQQQKRVTIITDPHIKKDPEFFVYKEGLEAVVAKE